MSLMTSLICRGGMQWRIFLAVTWITPPLNKLLYAVHKILLQNQNCFSDVEKSVRLNMIEDILRKTKCVRR
jgi:hypothetical protein